jgi:hypothetical protein
MVPRAGNSPASIREGGLPWACDNDAFGAFDAARFRRMLARFAGQPGCLFVSCPDVVCDPSATLRLFGEWAPEIRAAGLPLAFVGQDGCEDMELPWGEFDAFFVGGSTAWKESLAAMLLCGQAASMGKWVHVGRVNSYRRVRKLHDWGTVDSIDGTTFSKWPDKYLPLACRWLDRLRVQPTLRLTPMP